MCYENKSFRAAIILIYSGIDAMAALDIPCGQTVSGRNDFIKWCDRYLKFKSMEKITGTELYAARCGIIHTYSSESDFLKRENCRQIGYMDRSAMDVIYKPDIDETLVMVSVEALINAFFSAINEFLIEALSNSGRSRSLKKG
ncbi:hypothetical protein J2W98_000524 [Paenibacillus peoriae]|uniref:Uncharacterized protein n=1 Tax=Paenibacillus peoriae TaxID=59893 RepID=A0ABU1QA24_9BACL|nr:hypothetical protein [Paenibacillus peoriae]MDR6776277.1 hypothetical protein [Paenibacillus peoriae]